jgi:uncharacterized membrane protein HdeD (DUF308 family)
MANPQNIAVPDSPAPVAAGHSWDVVWGILLVIAGFLAVMMPGVAALATTVVFAWVLLLAGVLEIGYSLHMRQETGFGWKLFSGILTLVLGIAILLFPLAGVASLGLLVGSFLFVGGIARTALALQCRGRRGWGWILLDGLISLALAVLVALGWPQSSVPLIGVLTGLWLLSTGLWRILVRQYRAA